MLIKITIAVLCAALSTPLFPYRIMNTRKKKSETSLKYPSSEKFSALEMFLLYAIALLLFASSLGFSYGVFTHYDDRQIWYLYLLPAAFPVIWQFIFACIWAKRKILVLPILAVVFLFITFMPARNLILPYQSTVTNTFIIPYFDNDGKKFKVRVTSETVKYMEFRNGQIICTIDGENSGLGVFIIGMSSGPYVPSNQDNISYIVKDEYTTEGTVSFSFYPCEYEYSVKGPIRENYKSEEIVPLEIVINNQTPYGKFAILKRDGIFAKPQIDYYLLFNMVTGEISEYSEEPLSQFAHD